MKNDRRTFYMNSVYFFLMILAFASPHVKNKMGLFIFELTCHYGRHVKKALLSVHVDPFSSR
ncbi:hypothetical protein BCR42DRAFT_400927 [Absidia repens]|uniref:Uncharacterized protein n=1 Tax=Absidia repens TaxID=90262 RepID=A0A1X2J1U8_9FUNG|nr:hypothetical protein BCR42DRAFT_400927 [Absidia repens]